MYVRITVFLTNGQHRSGIRHAADSEKLENIRVHAARLSADVLGREAIIDVTVEILPARTWYGRTSLYTRSMAEATALRQRMPRNLYFYDSGCAFRVMEANELARDIFLQIQV
jgi:hypothetical protein